MSYSGTYSPEDDKLRLSCATRLDEETYQRVKAAGFSWAPKQQVFYAVWSPSREDLLLELAGEISDEDTSLVERAEDRAERFEGYHESRKRDAEQSRDAVAQIADGIPLGQPILVGHHSEKHARRDAEKIENGMRKAVRMWETAEYWTSRARGAVLHAKYLERPDVRYRRIKGLESDLRKEQQSKERAELGIKRWTAVKDESDEEKRRQLAVYVANNLGSNPTLPRKEGDRAGLHSPDAYAALTGSGVPRLWVARTLEEIIGHCLRVYPNGIAYRERWIAHLNNRLVYEHAMLDEQGGSPDKKYDFAVGGRVHGPRSMWYVITKLNKKHGRLVSLSTNGGVVSVENVKDYKPPEDGDAEKVKAATRLPRMCNYPGDNFLHMTKAEWDKLSKDYKGSEVFKANDKHGEHRVRKQYGFNRKQPYTYLTDSKRVDPPAAPAQPAAERPVLPKERDLATALAQPVYQPREKTEFDAMRDQLKTGGVQVVSAEQLFPTPAPLAERMVELAEIEPGHEVCDPEAGTGRILQAIQEAEPQANIFGVEINGRLAEMLSQRFTPAGENICRNILQGDFLEIAPGQIGPFDRIIMNPPFANGQDIAHIWHAYHFLSPNGILVAIASEGAFYRSDHKAQEFRDWLLNLEVEETEDGIIGARLPRETFKQSGARLPRETFKQSGTSVATRLIVIRRLPEGRHSAALKAS